MCINVSIYLPWLLSQCLKNGVKFRRANITHISEATGLHHSNIAANLVVNCTGLASASLGGVSDSSMYPARGQTVLVRNEAGPMICTSGTTDGDSEISYMMQRAAGGGTILGGSYQIGNWDAKPDPALAQRIMKRAVQLCPALTGGRGLEHLDVVRHAVGLRPGRKNGIRIEREKGDGFWIFHNYGHGAYGYQTSYGCAEKLVSMIEALPKKDSKL
jgi:D-amino-acid oxidase